VSDERFIKVRFEEGETGWAEDLGGGLARISNIPFSGDHNIDDIVKLEPAGDGWLRVKEIVSRRYPVRETIWFDQTGQYYLMQSVMSLLQGRVEGGVSPTPADSKKKGSQPRPGFMMVACTKHVNPVLLAEAVGIPHKKLKQKVHTEMERHEEPERRRDREA